MSFGRHTTGTYRVDPKFVFGVAHGGFFPASDSTPVVWEHDGTKQIVVAGSLRLVAYDPKDGGELWWVNGLARVVSPTPSLDVESGKLLKQGRADGRGNYYASPVAGDGKVYMASERGVITVFEAGRQWKTLSWHDFGERIMATPVIAEGRIYVRTDEALYCFRK